MCFAVLTNTLSAQINTTILDANQFEATLTDGGIFFAKPDNTTPGTTYSPGLEWPQGSSKFAMKGLSFWFAGKNVNGQLYSSTPTEEISSQQFSGPLSTFPTEEYGEATPMSYDGWLNSLFAVSKQEIDYHIANYTSPGYIVPQSILNWPAHGDISAGASLYLAPFVDADNNGFYTPETGDYPCIRGDRAVYLIMNDKARSSNCGLPKNLNGMGLELHYMFYQYETMPELKNTIFCHLRMINRSTETYFNFKSSIYLNGQIGDPSDDFAGTNSSRSMIYTYNGNAIDQSNNSQNGYGNKPPAVGVVSLNHQINRSRVFEDFYNYNYTMPVYQSDFWNCMNGKYYDGTEDPIQFGFDGNPYLNTGNVSMLPEGRVVCTIDKDILVPGENVEYDFAIITSLGDDNLHSVNQLFQDADYVQSFFNGQSDLCGQQFLSINNPTEIEEVKIYPNPSTGNFTLKVEEGLIGAEYSIINLNGQVISGNHKITTTENSIHQLDQPSGIYLLELTNDGLTERYRIIVE